MDRKLKAMARKLARLKAQIRADLRQVEQITGKGN